MKYLVVIRLSRRRISFFYARDDNQNGLVPFDGSRVNMPFAILRSTDTLEMGEVAVRAARVGSPDAYTDIFEDMKRPGGFVMQGEKYSFNKLPLLAIEHVLREHLATLLVIQGKSFEDAKHDLPLGFIFDDCLTDDEQLLMLNLFANNGYGNVGEVNYNAYLLGRVRNHPKALILSGDGVDLSCRLYDRERGECIGFKVLPDLGVDPRVEVAAELIWKEVLIAGELRREKVMPVLRDEAQRFLDSGKSEHEGAVTLEGLDRNYFIRRRKIDDGMTTADNGRLLPGILDFIDNAKVAKADCPVILSHSLAKNVFFANTLNASFPEMITVDDSWEAELMKAIPANIQANNYKITGGDTKVLSHDNEGFVADEIPLDNIKAELSDTSITFSIDFPEGASFVEIYRDGVLLKRMQKQVPRFPDTGLEVEKGYEYRFVAVFIDKFGKQLRTRGRVITYHTIPVVLPDPVLINKIDKGNAVELKWVKPELGDVKVYYSEKPFVAREGERVSPDEFEGKPLDTVGQQYSVRKDFMGERFFMPVTIIDGVAIAGNQERVESTVMPDNVGVDNANGEVRVRWAWKDLSAVRVSWQSPGDDNGQETISRYDNEGKEREPLFPIPLAAKTSEVEVRVQAVCQKSDDSLLVSECKTLNVSMTPVNVSFIEVKKKRGGNDYAVRIKADALLPCDLHLLVKENSDEFNAAYDSPCKIIKAASVKPGREFNDSFAYVKKDEYADLHFCVVAADEELDGRFSIQPQKLKVDGPKRPVTVGAEPNGTSTETKVNMDEPNNRTARNVIIALLLAVLAVGGYLAFTHFHSTQEKTGVGDTDTIVVSVPDESTANQPKTDTKKADEPKLDESKGEKPKVEKPKEEKPKEEKLKEEKLKERNPKEEKPKVENPKEEKPKVGNPEEEKPKEGNPEGKIQLTNGITIDRPPVYTGPTTVTVNSNVPNGVVFVDDVEKGKAPWRGELSQGEHTFVVKVMKKGKVKRTLNGGTQTISGRNQIIKVNSNQ